ncbi:hypothetical protein D5R93_02150 [Actinomyces lilanjuaniae]|uniref:Uncharacterized protein n=1 Tax=Actinomyces lilanjuaniae TaxID=2321394 RepID=A0ABN5PR60_9ACTO|nr:hypothetical protein D5R93_02150 [Actinomyces lilanjuaniae]
MHASLPAYAVRKAATTASVVPAPLVFIGAATSTYIGAGFAVSLFGAMPPTTVAWLAVHRGAPMSRLTSGSSG